MKKLLKLLLILSIIGLVVFSVVFGLKSANITNLEQVQQIINNAGIWGYFVAILITYAFMLGQFLPTAVINIACVYAFGLYGGIAVSMVATLSGALLLFLLGRKFGVKIAKWVVGSEDIDKWREKLTKGKYTLFFLLLFPASPDSLLYVLAGMTKLKTSTYLLILMLSKPIGIFTTCLFGGGAIIPLTWAYAWLWAILGLVMVFVLWASVKYQNKIDEFIEKITKKRV